MDPTNIRELIQALCVEVLRFRYWIILGFIAMSSAVLAAGYFLPKSYNSKVVLYADQTNIIGDLLEGKAEITRIDHAREVRNIVYTNRMLRSAAATVGFDDPDKAIVQLRNAIHVRSRGDYVDIEFASENKDRAYSIIGVITELFINETSRKKREESQSAFEFINAQVESYKKQLEAAEQNLKEFSADNIDVSEQSVSNRVSTLKRDIQNYELEVQDSIARMSSYERQLEKESQFLKVETKNSDSYSQNQLESFRQQLANLRLSYLDTHPDIVSLLGRIDSLNLQIKQEEEASRINPDFEQVENPAFTNLKDDFNQEQANLNAKEQRLKNLKSLLASELDNAGIVAEKQATYAELTRDYAVTKDVYDDMVRRRESARLSMTLDVQGQGVTYKIHEPPFYPTNWEGLQLKHYAMVGPFLGISFPLGMIVLFVLLDPRIRSSTFMEENLPPQIEMITSVPAYNGLINQYSSKRSVIVLISVLAVYMASYAVLAVGFDEVSLILLSGK